jgi:hypothetical protein
MGGTRTPKADAWRLSVLQQKTMVLCLRYNS